MNPSDVTIPENFFKATCEALNAIGRGDQRAELEMAVTKIEPPPQGIGVTVNSTIHLSPETNFKGIQTTLDSLHQVDQQALYNGVTPYGVASMFQNAWKK